MKTSKRLLVNFFSFGAALLFLLSLSPGVAHATTIDEVTAKVNEEYNAGHMDAATKSDLNATLSDAKNAPSAEARSAYIDTFKELIAGGTITSAAASTLISMANGL